MEDFYYRSGGAWIDHPTHKLITFFFFAYKLNTLQKQQQFIFYFSVVAIEQKN